MMGFCGARRFFTCDCWLLKIERSILFAKVTITILFTLSALFFAPGDKILWVIPYFRIGHSVGRDEKRSSLQNKIMTFCTKITYFLCPGRRKKTLFTFICKCNESVKNAFCGAPTRIKRITQLILWSDGLILISVLLSKRCSHVLQDTSQLRCLKKFAFFWLMRLSSNSLNIISAPCQDWSLR